MNSLRIYFHIRRSGYRNPEVLNLSNSQIFTFETLYPLKFKFTYDFQQWIRRELKGDLAVEENTKPFETVADAFYACTDYYLEFENEDDAVFFKLKWM